MEGTHIASAARPLRLREYGTYMIGEERENARPGTGVRWRASAWQQSAQATVTGMGREPSNEASEFAYRSVELLNDRDFMVRNGLSLCTEDFIRYDRRRMTAQPPADRQGWLDAMLTFEELSGGHWPTFELTGTLAVRGRRLAANRWTMGLGEAGEVEFVVVTRTDEAVDKMELIYFFDPEDTSPALAELDRLHAELESDGQ